MRVRWGMLLRVMMLVQRDIVRVIVDHAAEFVAEAGFDGVRGGGIVAGLVVVAGAVGLAGRGHPAFAAAHEDFE